MKASAWRLRAALFVLVALIALRSWSLLKVPAEAWTAQRSSVRALREEQVAVMARGTAVAAKLASLRLLLRDHQHEYLRALPGQRPAETLSLLVLSAAERSGFVIESVTPEEIRESGALPEGETATVVVGGVGSLSEISWWMAMIESGAPRLGVSTLQLTRQGSESEDLLRVQATVVGLVATMPLVADSMSAAR